jgi:hypothetical protein
MDATASRGDSRLGPVLMIVGAAAVAVGSVLPWFRLKADFSSFGGPGAQVTTAKGLDTSDGKIFLVVAIGVAVLGLAAIAAKAKGPRRVISIIGALAALFVGAVGIYDAATPKAQAIDEASKRVGGGIAVDAAKRFIEGLFDQGFIKIEVQVGLWIVVAGAAVALVGALVSAVTARGAVPVPVAAMPMPAPSESAWAQAAPSPSSMPASAPLPSSMPEPLAPQPPTPPSPPAPGPAGGPGPTEEDPPSPAGS